MTQTFSRLTTCLAAASLSVATLAAAGQQSTVVVDNDDITIRGCVGRVSPAATERMLVWTRGDIMLSNPNALRSGQLADRVFYWLDDDEDLSKHVGQMARVPTAWFGASRGEGDVDIIARKIDVDDVKVLGACPTR